MITFFFFKVSQIHHNAALNIVMYSIRNQIANGYLAYIATKNDINNFFNREKQKSQSEI